MWRSSRLGAGTTLALAGSLCVILFSGVAIADPACPLLAKAGHIPCAVVMGRIVACDAPSYAARSEATENEGAGERETLCIQANDGNYVLRYERVTNAEQIAIDFLGAGELRLDSRTGTTRVQFAQPLKGRLQLSVDSSGEQKRVEATTLWHLLLAEPQLCEKHLLPLLESIHPDWKLAGQAKAVEHMLMAAEDRADQLSIEQVRSLVDDLAQPSFAVRQAAYRELVGRGPAILPQLAQLKLGTLDAEQRARLAEVRSNFSYASPDTTERVATWLRSDRETWQALSQRSDKDIRQIAAEHLK